MVDQKDQSIKIKNQINTAIIKTINSIRFINGPLVTEFSNSSQDFIIQKIKDFLIKIKLN